jgi:hypothetical protein
MDIFSFFCAYYMVSNHRQNVELLISSVSCFVTVFLLVWSVICFSVGVPDTEIGPINMLIADPFRIRYAVPAPTLIFLMYTVRKIS